MIFQKKGVREDIYRVLEREPSVYKVGLTRQGTGWDGALLDLKFWIGGHAREGLEVNIVEHPAGPSK